MQEGDYDLTNSNWITVGTGDPEAFLLNWYGDGGNNFFTADNTDATNYCSYDNEEFNKLYEQFVSSLDEQERKDLVVEMEQILINDCAVLVHGYYKIDLPENSFADHLAPILRWDVGNDVDYLNTDARRREGFDANRITVGLNVGFGEKLIRSEIRFNYEKYLPSRKPSDFARNKLLHDKFTIEVVAAF